MRFVLVAPLVFAAATLPACDGEAKPEAEAAPAEAAKPAEAKPAPAPEPPKPGSCNSTGICRDYGADAAVQAKSACAEGWSDATCPDEGRLGECSKDDGKTVEHYYWNTTEAHTFSTAAKACKESGGTFTSTKLTDAQHLAAHQKIAEADNAEFEGQFSKKDDRRKGFGGALHTKYTVRFPKTYVAGDADAHNIWRILRAHSSRFRDCAKKGLTSKERNTEKLHLFWTIDAEGKADAKYVGGSLEADHAAVKCVVEELFGDKIKFAPAWAGNEVHWTLFMR